MAVETPDNITIDTRDKTSPKRLKKSSPEKPSPLYGQTYLVDREIAKPEDDAFGHRHFADVLRSLVEGASHQPPFSIGLLGSWGTGKSSIKRLYLEDLTDDESRVNGRTRKQRHRAITFNAWRFGGSDIKRALLRHVYLELGGQEENLKDQLNRTIQRQRNESKSWREWLGDVLEKWLFLPLQLFLFLGVATLAIWLIPKVVEVSGNWPKVAISLIPAALVIYVARKLFEDLPFWLVPRRHQVVSIEAPKTSAEDYEELLLKQLREYKRSEGKKIERLIIFVDDLDRLSAEEMVSGLDAVRTFMELPAEKVPDGPGIIFVISCDEDRVAAALADRRWRASTEMPGAIGTRSDARRYLDRIFQFRLEIPPFPPQDMRAFAKDRMVRAMSDVVSDLGISQLDEVIDRMIHVGVQDPRKAIQIVNAFAQGWRLAKRREIEGPGSTKAGGLESGAVSRHPEALAVVSAIRVSFPDFYTNLEQAPGLLSSFIEYFLRSSSQGIPDRELAMLRQMQSDAKDSGNSETPVPIHDDYRDLFQFVSGVRWIKWPQSLQPLILLSQDTLTRGSSDRAIAVRDALVSANPAGVLEALGRHFDTGPFTSDEVDLLRAVLGDIEHDTEFRQNNAAYALADLAPRIPSDSATRLLTAVARRLRLSADLRSRVGLERIQGLLPQILAPDRRDLLGVLVGDIIPLQGPMRFRTESGEEWSLDEGIALVESVVPLALGAWRNGEVSEPTKTQLANWLVTRHVDTGTGTQDLSFVQLESWVSAYEHELLEALSGRYVEQLVIAIEPEAEAGLDITQATERAKTVMSSISKSDRGTFWQLAVPLISAKNEQLVHLGSQIGADHILEADPNSMEAYILAFIDRMIKENSTEESWSLENWESPANSLVAQLQQKEKALSDKVLTQIGRLASTWGNNDSTPPLAISLYDMLQRRGHRATETVIDAWISLVGKDAGKGIVLWIGQHFEEALTEQQRVAMVSALKPLFAKTTLKDAEIAQVAAFTEGQKAADQLTSESHTLVVDALGSLSTYYTTAGYVEKVLPAVAPVIPRVPAKIVGPSLTAFVTNAQSVPSTLTLVHQQLGESWPRPVGDGYDPRAIFDFAVNNVSAWKAMDGAGDVLRSLRNMIRWDLIPESRISELLATAVEVWNHVPAEAADVIVGYNTEMLSPTQVAAIGNATDISKDASISALHRVWHHTARLLKPEERLHVTQALLETSPRGSGGQADLVLSTWVDAQDANIVSHLGQVLRDKTLPDERRARLWAQVSKRTPAQTLDEVIGLLTAALDPPVEDGTITSIERDLGEIAKKAASQQDKLKLVQALVPLFVEAESARVQHLLARTIADIGNDSIFSNGDGLDSITAEQGAILREYFPKSRHLKTLLERIVEREE